MRSNNTSVIHLCCDELVGISRILSKISFIITSICDFKCSFILKRRAVKMESERSNTSKTGDAPLLDSDTNINSFVASRKRKSALKIGPASSKTMICSSRLRFLHRSST